MNSTFGKKFSNQTIQIYRLLLEKKKLTANQIASPLNILPNAVYRIVNKLFKLGLVEQNKTYPRSFVPKPLKEAWENFLSYQKKVFYDIILGTDSKKKKINIIDFNFAFIQGRKEVFKQCIEDLNQTKKIVKFIVLGLSIGISPELMLAEKKAIERRVKIKEIVQEYSQENKEVLRSWIKLGVDVRFSPSIGFHLLLFDDKISYIMSYDPRNRTKRYAVRIFHKDINQQLQEIFNKYWCQAEKIKI